MAVSSDEESNPEFLEGEIFENEPSSTVRTRFLDHVRKTGEPESFPGLCTTAVSGSEPYVIVAPFVVELSKRPDLDCIPCAICSPRKGKFLDGRLVYYPHDERIRVIGHECADAHLDAIATANYEMKLRKEADEEFLLANFFNVPAMLQVIEKLKVVAQEYQKISKAFSAQAPAVIKLLRKQARDNDGFLTVDVAREEPSNDDTETNERIGPAGYRGSQSPDTGYVEVVDNLLGQTALKPDYAPSDECSEVLDLLQPYAHENEDSALEALSKMNDIEKALCVAHLRAAENLFLSVEQSLRDFSSFFTKQNFDALAGWGAHPLNNTKLHAEVDGNTFVVGSSLRSVFKVTLDTRPPSDTGWPGLTVPRA